MSFKVSRRASIGTVPAIIFIAVQNKIVSSSIVKFEGQGNTNIKKILN